MHRQVIDRMYEFMDNGNKFTADDLVVFGMMKTLAVFYDSGKCYELCDIVAQEFLSDPNCSFIGYFDFLLQMVIGDNKWTS